ncbi:MAG: hypothetical protein E7621_00290 [Ruminococcaceae bacterium]|nr:hypothetical protein [Oscillospiraceae bacterium]
MNKRLQGALAGVLIGVLLTGGISYAKTAVENISVNYNNIKVYVDNERQTLKDANGTTIEPFIYNGTTYLPVRAVAELADMTVTWDDSTKSVYLWDRTVPEQDLVVVCPPYKSKNCSVYGVGDYFNMDGQKYDRGFRLFSSAGYAQFNLEGKYKTLEVTIGHSDTTDRDKSVTFIIDGKNAGTVSLPAGCKPQRYSVDLNRCSDLKISIDGGPDIGFGVMIVK